MIVVAPASNVLAVATMTAIASALGCGGGWQLGPEASADGGGAAVATLLDACESPIDEAPPTAYTKGLHVVGDHFEDSAGSRVTLRGVNRSGSEYKCVQSGGFFDGPCNDASTLRLPVGRSMRFGYR